MPISDGYKAIDEVWASNAAADRTDPESTTLTPPLDVEDGWPDSFSADAGNTPRRPVMNEIYHRETSALVDVRNYGILPWDTAVDTLAGGVKQVSGVLYRALVDNGPTYSNAISPTAAGQTVWETVAGVTSAPSAPSAPQANSPESGELDWFWNCPLDGGAQVTEFDFQWRVAGTLLWSASIMVNTARHVLTGLTNGVAIEAQVRARSSHDTGPFSATGSSTPSGTVPGGGATLALRATAGDGEIGLDWLEPDDGGVNITSYTVQWRTSGQSFSAGRQATSTNQMHTIGSLINDTEYFFHVRAVNGEGNGAWSNEASATPSAASTIIAPPADTDPNAPTDLEAESDAENKIDWSWTWPSNDGGARVTRFQLQWRLAGNNWAGNIIDVGATTCASHTVPNRNKNVEARVKAFNTVGDSPWSSTGDILADDIAEDTVRTGTMIDFGGLAAPTGYLACDGTAYSRSTYADLFVVIGTRFGAGNGSSTFNVPTTQRRGTVGSGGTGTSELGNAVGDTGGDETVTLTTGQMPSHSHGDGSLSVSSGGSHSHGSGTLSAASAGSHSHSMSAAHMSGDSASGVDLRASNRAFSTNAAGSHTHSVSGSTSSGGTHSHSISGDTSTAGSGQAHNNLPPSLVMLKAIKT